MTGLPKGWVGSTLDAIADVVGGITKGPVTADSETREVPYLRVANVQRGRLDLRELKFIQASESEITKLQLNVGDILFTEGGDRDKLGRGWVWNGEIPECIHQNHIFRARLQSTEIVPELISWYANSKGLQYFLQNAKQTTNLASINMSILRRLPVLLPPKAEQKRIADKLDALLARVDACRERLDRVPGILKRFRQSVLAAATSGELTREWREERGIAREWAETRLEDIAFVGTGSTPLRSNSAFYAATGTPWITSSMTGLPFVTRADEFVTDAAITAHRLKKYPVGTLLLAMYGEGRTRGQVTELQIEATINQACAAIRVDERKAMSAFVRLALEANYLEMRELAEGGNQPNLNLSKVKEFQLSLPSLDEQRVITAQVQAIYEWLGKIESRLSAVRRHVDRSTQALLAKAFRGELVPQDPNDEPASVLLERIRAARAAQDAAPKSGKAARRGRSAAAAST